MKNDTKMKDYIDLANDVIDRYCAAMDLPREILGQKKTTKKVRRYKSTNVAFMRQSLGHYLYQKLPLYALDVGRLVGYSDHSMVSLYSRIVEIHFETNDPSFIPYYRKLEQIADPLVKHLGFRRMGAYHFFKSEDKRLNNIKKVKTKKTAL